MNPNSYTAQLGTNVTMTCETSGLAINGIVLAYYSTTPPITPYFIYLNMYPNFTDKYVVRFSTTGNNITVYLTILNVDLQDQYYSYDCTCYMYGGCFPVVSS
ncbi:unnamed protein product, partial [Brachionus calyciflorus]